MKTLILFRHGNAQEDVKDWERDLSTVGVEEVRKVSSEILKRKETLPKRILCSEAKRARHTHAIYAELDPNAKSQSVFHQIIYHGCVRDLEFLLGDLPPEMDHVMIIGHNPVLSEFAEQLSKQPVNLGTANAAVLVSANAKGAWQPSLYEEWKLDTILKPS